MHGVFVSQKRRRHIGLSEGVVAGVVWAIVPLACKLTAWMQILALAEHVRFGDARCCEPKRLFLIPARHARSSRRLLRLAATASFTVVALAALDALTRVTATARAQPADTPAPRFDNPETGQAVELLAHPSDLEQTVTRWCDSRPYTRDKLADDPEVDTITKDCALIVASMAWPRNPRSRRGLPLACAEHDLYGPTRTRREANEPRTTQTKESYNFEPSGKSIIVTGGASGIGAETARRAGGRGARVTIADLDAALGAERVAEIIGQGGQAQFVQVDIDDETQVRAMVSAAVSAYGRLDGACNSAARPPYSSARHGMFPFADLPTEHFVDTIRTNVIGTFHCIKHEISAMLQTGGGAVVNISSGAGVFAIPNAPDYVSSKHAIIGLTKSAALDYATRGVRVNAVLPGTIETPMMLNSGPEGDPEQYRALWEATMPVGRLGQPGEVADAILWLLSDEASLMTGASVPVDGGQTMV